MPNNFAYFILITFIFKSYKISTGAQRCIWYYGKCAAKYCPITGYFLLAYKSLKRCFPIRSRYSKQFNMHLVRLLFVYTEKNDFTKTRRHWIRHTVIWIELVFVRIKTSFFSNFKRPGVLFLLNNFLCVLFYFRNKQISLLSL